MTADEDEKNKQRAKERDEAFANQLRSEERAKLHEEKQKQEEE